MERLRQEKEELQNELTAAQQRWTKDREDLLHKARQEEKVTRIRYCFSHCVEIICLDKNNVP